jgi:hypothetical protein
MKTDVARYRREILARILRIAGAGSVGLAALSATTCGRSPLRGDGAPRAATGGGGNGGAGGATATSGNGGAGGLILLDAGDVATAATGILLDGGYDGDAAVSIVDVCVPPDANGMCPDAANAGGILMGAGGPCAQIVAIISFTGMMNGLCCYEVEEVPFPCYVGRTFFLDEGVVKADLRPGASWRTRHHPSAEALPARTRRALGEAWARDGLFEHASVASFARFTMQLLALGAPADLVRDTQAATIDEVKHAEMCLALASGYLGRSVEPSALPFPGPVAIGADLAAVVAETVMEGCIGETVATVQALEALGRATDPAVREILEATVEDEARHAELAWRFVAWAVDAGGAPVREAVARSFAAFRPPPPSPEDLDGVDLDLYAAHGRQVAREARAIAELTLREIVEPGVCALLARRSPVYAAAGSHAESSPPRRAAV